MFKINILKLVFKVRNNWLTAINKIAWHLFGSNNRLR